MFEPENDIERMLVRASAEPAARPGFARALLDAEIYVVLVPDRPIVPGPDGRHHRSRGYQALAAERRAWRRKVDSVLQCAVARENMVQGEIVAAPDRARDLFGRYPDAPFVLNPGSDYGKDFTPTEVKRLLAGVFDDGPRPVTIQAGEKVLLGHPREVPEALIAALRRELSVARRARSLADARDNTRPK